VLSPSFHERDFLSFARCAVSVKSFSGLISMAPRSLFAALLAGLLLFDSSACTVPLAPGYQIVTESREVRFVPEQPPRLEIQARYTVQNTGTSSLYFVDVIFPDEKLFGRKDLRVEVNGQEAKVTSLPAEHQRETPNAMRIPLDPPWKQKQRRELAIDYVFSSPEDSGARITLDDSSFHLGSRGWFPLLQPPKHPLAPYPRRPDKSVCTVRVPASFTVLSRGTPAGKKRDGGEVEYRFELRSKDLAPYVVAGRYVETASQNRSDAAVFWTIEPLKENAVPTEERIAAAWSILQTDFGPLDKNIRVPHIVEAVRLRAHVGGEPGPTAAAFPGGVIVNPEALALGIGSEDFLEQVTHALAHNWFGDEMYPASNAALGMGEGLPEYATIVIDESRNGEASRRRRILEYLRRYDAALKEGAENPLGVTTLNDPPEQRRIGLAKAPLFLASLEDACGKAPMWSGIRSLVMLLRGQEVGYDDLRAALEQSSGKDLAETFRIWLYEKGIPADFRGRYQGETSGKTSENSNR
jgi:hypothetical protein